MVPPTANPAAAGSSADHADADGDEGPATEDPYNNLGDAATDDAGSQKNRVSVFRWVGVHRFL